MTPFPSDGHPALRGSLLLGLCTLTACLGSPTGKARSWPLDPAQGQVIAVASGDVDGDGITDLAVLEDGSAAGVYLLLGGSDLTLSQSPSTFSRVAAITELSVPAAIAIFGQPGAAGHVVVTHAGGSGEKVEVFTGPSLTPGASAAVSGTPGDAQSLAWVRQTPFGPGGNFILFNVGTDIFHVEPNALFTTTDPAFDTLPPPGAGGWGQSAFVGGSSSKGDVWVAASDAIWTGTAGSGPINWQKRRSGSTWPAQAPLDLTGDGREAIVGLDASNPSALCAVEPDTGDAPGCLTTTLRLPPGGAVALVSDDVTGDGVPDLIVGAAGASPVVGVLPGVHLDTVNDRILADTALYLPGEAAGSLVVTGHFSSAPARQILAVGGDGTIGCYQVQSGAISRCGGP